MYRQTYPGMEFLKMEENGKNNKDFYILESFEYCYSRKYQD